MDESAACKHETLADQWHPATRNAGWTTQRPIRSFRPLTSSRIL